MRSGRPRASRPRRAPEALLASRSSRSGRTLHAHSDAGALLGSWRRSARSRRYGGRPDHPLPGGRSPAVRATTARTGARASRTTWPTDLARAAPRARSARVRSSRRGAAPFAPTGRLRAVREQLPQSRRRRSAGCSFHPAWAAEDYETLVREPVHECGVVGPPRLLDHRARSVPSRPAFSSYGDVPHVFELRLGRESPAKPRASTRARSRSGGAIHSTSSRPSCRMGRPSSITIPSRMSASMWTEAWLAPPMPVLVPNAM